MRSLLYSHLIPLIPVFAAVLILFGHGLMTDRYLVGGDLSIHGAAIEQDKLPDGFIGSWTRHLWGVPVMPYNPLPRRFLLMLTPPATYVTVAYMLDIVLSFVAMFFFLQTKCSRKMPAITGALAMALSSHTITLVSAGHLSKLGMMPFAIFSLFSLDRAIERQSMFLFACAGATAGIGFSEHQDVMMMLGMLIAAYGIFKLFMCLPGYGKMRYLAKNMAGVVVAGILFGAIAFPSLMGTFTLTVPGRATIAQSPAQKWEFATNWSLPPEEMLEFVAPFVYGVETGNTSAPYWGRLGRTKNWEKTRQGLFNLRQHTVYLGVFQLMFALYAVFRIITRKKSVGVGHVALDDAQTVRREIVFWSAAWLIGVLLALGRYGPLYRLFYLLPYASGIRAPVKFMHLVEIATAMLFFFGLRFLFSDSDLGKSRAVPVARKGQDCRTYAPGAIAFAVASGASGLMFLVVSWWVLGKPAFLLDLWQKWGIAAYSETFTKTMSAALVRAGIMFLMAGAIFWARCFLLYRRWFSACTWLCLLFILWVDQVTVARKYVRVGRMSDLYADDVVVDYLRLAPGPFRVMCVGGDGLVRRWQSYALPNRGVNVFDLSVMSGLSPDHKAYVEALSRQPLRLWQLGSIRYLVGSKTDLASLVNHPAFQPVISVAAVRRVNGMIGLDTVVPDKASHVVLLNRAALPYASVFYDWQRVEEGKEFERLGDPSWNPGRQLLVVGGDSSLPNDRLPDPATVAQYDWTRIAIDAEASEGGILLLNEKYDKNWHVQVDGMDAQLLRCNGIMRGVRLPAGRHRVVFIYRSPYTIPVLLRFGAIILVLVWGAIPVFVRRLWPASQQGHSGNDRMPVTDGDGGKK
ncbi:MAG: YfhO family protein [Lentisphaerae bacterium]|nr:YfhO family protein [Lentisphaerota bacterium]